MTSSPNPASSTIFGRETELSTLSSMLNTALTGTTQFAMIVGEPGIGKTRLVEELEHQAVSKGATVAWGPCLDGEGAPPHWPVIQILESLNNSINGGISALESPSAALLTPLLPELNAPGSSTNDSSISDQSQEAFAVSRAIRDVITRTTSQNPLLLIFEDIHWADEASLASLNLLVNSVRNLPLMIAATYRDTDVVRTRALASILPSLSRAPGATRVPVTGLEPSHINQLLSSLAGESSSSINSTEIEQRTGGNPFFIREIASSINANSGGFRGSIPEGIREAIGRRLEDLSETGLKILRIGSIVGRSFDSTVVSDVLESETNDRIVEECEALVDLGILVESPDHIFNFSFAHALFQETVNAEITTSQRVRTHAKIAEVLEAKHGKSNASILSEIAHHYAESELLLGPDKAVEFAVEAGRHAVETLAFDTAVNIVDRVLELARNPEHPELGELLLIRAQSLPSTAQAKHSLQERWDAVQTAFDHFIEKENWSQAVDAALVSVPIAGIRGPYATLEKAMELIEDNDDRKPWLELRLGVATGTDLGKDPESLEIFKKVNELAEQQNHIELQTLSKAHMGQASVIMTQFDQGIEYGIESIELAEQHGHWYSAGRVVLFLFAAMLAKGRSDELADILSRIEASDLAPIHRSHLYETRSRLHLMRGEWEAASRERRIWFEFVGTLESAENEWSLIETYRGVSGDWLNQYQHELAHLASGTMIGVGWSSGYATAGALAYDLTQDPAALEPTRSMIGRIVTEWDGIQLLRDDFSSVIEALLAVGQSDTHQADDLLEKLNKIEYQFAPNAGVSIDRLRARLSIVANKTENTHNDFESAIRFCKESGFWPEHVRSCLDYANFLVSTGEHQKANEIANEGKQQAQKSRMELYLEQLEQVLEKSSSASSSEPASPVDETTPPALPDGLTQRELEVLQLVAAGHTNQQIADELFLSRYTVVRHVANIFAKTGASNRTEAATYANQNNLI